MKLNAREAARLLAMPESELYARVDDGTIPCRLVNKQPLFSDVELLEWATANKRPLAEPLFIDDGGLLADAIAIGGVHHDVPGDSVESVLRAIVDRLPLGTDDGDREMVLAILLARQAEVSTGVGDGIAIPHARAPLVFADRPAAIAVCFLAAPVAFDAIDDRPVHTVFAMITPTIRGHLQMLSRLAIGLHVPEFRDVIARRASRDEIVAAAARVDAMGKPA